MKTPATKTPSTRDKAVPGIVVTDLQPLGPRSRAIVEVGKALLVESIATGREFCKFLITLATGGIPIFAALLGLFLPKGFRPSFSEALLMLVPPVLFLSAAIIAGVGYLPREREIAVEILDEIEAERKRIIRWRRRLGLLAFGVFLLGVLTAILGTALAAYSFQRPAGAP